MNNYKKVLLNKLPEFKDYTLNFINGNISTIQYKDFSSRYGVFAQRDKKTFMIRLRNSCGIISRQKLHSIYNIANKYNLNFIHLTTRQNIQLHNIGRDSIVDILKEGVEKDIFTTCSRCNFPYNVTLSPLSGVSKAENFDVTPYALENDHYFLKQNTSSLLPKKIRVSYCNFGDNLGHILFQDLGFYPVSRKNKNYFEAYIGGNLGDNPHLAIKLPHLIPAGDVLYYVKAIISLIIDEYDFENKPQNKVKYLIDKLGEDEFLDRINKLVQNERYNENLKILPELVDYNNYHHTTVNHNIKQLPQSIRLIPQKQENMFAVSIHPIGGMYKLKDLKILLNELDKLKNPVVRTSIEQDLYILNLDANEANKILDITNNLNGDTPIENSVACVGTPICQIGECNSQELLFKILSYFRDKNSPKNLKVMPKLYISGCKNSCGIHQIAEIGFCGKLKKIDSNYIDCYEMSIGGSVSNNRPKLGRVVGCFKVSDIPKMLYEISEVLIQKNINFKTLTENLEEDFNSVISKYTIK